MRKIPLNVLVIIACLSLRADDRDNGDILVIIPDMPPPRVISADEAES